jgi:hypothetical protein
MIKIILTICLANNLAQCKDLTLGPFEDPVNARGLPFMCQKFGLEEAAKEMEKHPNWVLRRWSCKPAGMFQDI